MSNSNAEIDAHNARLFATFLRGRRVQVIDTYKAACVTFSRAGRTCMEAFHKRRDADVVVVDAENAFTAACLAFSRAGRIHTEALRKRRDVEADVVDAENAYADAYKVHKKAGLEYERVQIGVTESTGLAMPSCDMVHRSIL